MLARHERDFRNEIVAVCLECAADSYQSVSSLTESDMSFAGQHLTPCLPLACGHRLRGRSLSLQLQHASRVRVSGKSRRNIVVQAASSGFSSEDPYKARHRVQVPASQSSSFFRPLIFRIFLRYWGCVRELIQSLFSGSTTS